jgi:hypothetical protein
MTKIIEIEHDDKPIAGIERLPLRTMLSIINPEKMEGSFPRLTNWKYQVGTVIAAASFVLTACSTPGTVHESKDAVAASSAAVAEASSAGAPVFAPLEMGTAQDELARANQALAEKDYKKARVLADEALVDAQAAQSKTNSIKAQQAAAVLQDDIRVLREELNRTTE